MIDLSDIRDEDGFRQKIVFGKDLRYGPKNNWRPTDIDMMMEIQDRLYITGEYKYSNPFVDWSKTTLLERTAKRFATPSSAGISFVAVHNHPTSEKYIDGGNAIVDRYYDGVCWRSGENIKVSDFVRGVIADYL